MGRILVVEDEPSIALVLGDDLRLEGHHPVVVRDGETAIREATSRPFDLILLDVMLPKQDGFEVCRAVRLAGIRAPIVMLTARTHESEKVLAFEAGADDYVTKPYGARELRARIKAHLRRADVLSAEIYRFGEIELDIPKGELRRKGKTVDTSALEFKLLSAFVRHEGRLVTRAQLLDEVWGVGTHVSDRVVDNQVNNLRKKIEPIPSQPRYLVSLRGLGYRFDREGVTDA